MDIQPRGKTKELLAALSVLIVIVVIVSTASMEAKRHGRNLVSPSTPSAASTAYATGLGNTSGNRVSTGASSPADPSAATNIYKDGSYSATGSYYSPDGIESITVNVTLQSGVITTTSANSGATDPDGQEYQRQFIAGYKQLVVGKDINSISLSRVSGSSLTSEGFNNALEQIKQQAQQSA